MRMIRFLFVFSQTLAFSYTTETLSEMPRIYLLHDFLSYEECDHMIKEARPHLKRSTVVSDKKPQDGEIDPRRTSQGMFFPQNPKDRILKRVEKRIADLTGLPVANGEAIQVLCYQAGGEYRPHYDFFPMNTPGGAAQLARGGQRVATVIMYLNTPEAGGETIFPHANVKINVAPKKGMAILFYSCMPNGAVDPMTLHGGAPVIQGEKWIATKWLREGVFH